MSVRQSNRALVILGIIPLALGNLLRADAQPAAAPYDIIRKEATAPNSETFHPLPLIGSWNAATWWNHGTSTAGYSPSWQMDMIDQGHHLLPWLEIPTPDMSCDPATFCYYSDYLETPIKRAAGLQLPISFVGTQWEHYLSEDPAYLNLPEGENPNAISVDGGWLRNLISDEIQVAPFGALAPWYEVGKRWGSSQLMQQLQQWYPDPPLVLFISNNEHPRMFWSQAESEKRYVQQYGSDRDDNFKRQVVAQGWEARYGELIRGFRDGLSNATWKAHSRFIGYEAFGPAWFGRWYGWKEYSLYSPGRVDPNPLYWQGGSPSLYIWPSERDNLVVGPLFGAMNWVFMIEEAHHLNPDFFFEFSSWDGGAAAWDKYTSMGQTLTPDRYGGMVQFGMWLTRPRIVREYKGWEEPRSSIHQWMTPLIEAVDRIYVDSTLRSFWRNSELVPNAAVPHPYQYDLPPEYASVERMFLLTTDLDPPQPWSYETEFPVMSLARVRGDSPNRQWLLYGYAPLGARSDVHITLPSYGTVTVDVALEGSFYRVDESTHTVSPVNGAAGFFADVSADHPYRDEIDALYLAGYTAGCATDPLRYCPEAAMSRAESSVFVERGIHTASYEPPMASTQVFADVPLDSWAAKWVNGLWEDQYTAGCGTSPLVYCPWQGHTRAEGCVFFLRMLHGVNFNPPQPAQQTFVDVPLDAWYAKWVQAGVDAGLIEPCQTSPELRFCPNDPLTRALAAYMMVQAKQLKLP